MEKEEGELTDEEGEFVVDIDELERVIELERQFTADMLAALQHPDRDEEARSEALGKRLARLSETVDRQTSKHKKIKHVVNFWKIIAEEVADDMWGLNMDRIAAYMEAVPLLAHALKQTSLLWKRKLILEYPEYWEKETVNGQLKKGVLKELQEQTHKSTTRLGEEVKLVSGFYLLYQKARALAVHLDKLAIGRVKQKENLRLVKRERVNTHLAAGEQHQLEDSGWTVVDFGSDTAISYLNLATGENTVFRPRIDIGNIEYRVLVARGILIIGDGPNQNLLFDEMLCYENRWRTPAPIVVTGARGMLLRRVLDNGSLDFIAPAIPGVAVRKMLAIPIDVLFEMAGQHNGVLTMDQLRDRFSSALLYGLDIQLGSGLRIMDSDRGILITHSDLDLTVVGWPNSNENDIVFVNQIVKSNLAVSHQRPFVYQQYADESFVTDSNSIRSKDRRSSKDYWITSDRFDPEDPYMNSVLFWSQANLFRYGRTVFKLLLSEEELLGVQEPIKHARKFANLLYVWISPVEVFVYDLFQLYSDAQEDRKHPLISGKLK